MTLDLAGTLRMGLALVPGGARRAFRGRGRGVRPDVRRARPRSDARIRRPPRGALHLGAVARGYARRGGEGGAAFARGLTSRCCATAPARSRDPVRTPSRRWRRTRPHRFSPRPTRSSAAGRWAAPRRASTRTARPRAASRAGCSRARTRTRSRSRRIHSPPAWSTGARSRAGGSTETRIPAGCEVIERPASAWDAYLRPVVALGSVILLQAALIWALWAQSRRRRAAEAESQRRRTEIAHVARLSVMGVVTASIAHEINQPLGAILSNADAADLMIRNGNVGHRAAARDPRRHPQRGPARERGDPQPAPAAAQARDAHRRRSTSTSRSPRRCTTSPTTPGGGACAWSRTSRPTCPPSWATRCTCSRC